MRCRYRCRHLAMIAENGTPGEGADGVISCSVVGSPSPFPAEREEDCDEEDRSYESSNGTLAAVRYRIPRSREDSDAGLPRAFEPACLLSHVRC